MPGTPHADLMRRLIARIKKSEADCKPITIAAWEVPELVRLLKLIHPDEVAKLDDSEPKP